MPSSYSLKVCGEWKPTGKARVRPGWFGGYVLQIEEARPTGSAGGLREHGWTGSQSQWRDARFHDLADKHETEADTIVRLLKACADRA